jgi:NAD+ synthase
MEERRLNVQRVKEKLVKFIRKQTQAAGFQKVLLGISGGLDSALVATLCTEALGEKNVFALILPYKTTSSQTLADARLVARSLQIKTWSVEISSLVDAYFSAFPDAGRIQRGNFMARMRMAVLYDFSKRLNALVVGTSNKSERLLGYGTIFGDLACAFNPIGNLYKTQVKQMAKALGLPKNIINKTPSADLWPGQTDEGELGLKYAQVDRLLYYLVDKRASLAKLVKLGFKKAEIEKVKARIAANEFKRRIPAIAEV